jgi:hypothetical protein
MKAIKEGNGSFWKFAVTLFRAFLVAGCFFWAASTFAQALSVQSGSSVDVAQPDSIVQLTADAQGLPLLPPDAVPASGTFWLVMSGINGGVTAPMPCPPKDTSLPIYQIANGQFLVDATGGQVAVSPGFAGRRIAATTVTDALEQEASSVVNLITRIQTLAADQQTQATMQAMGMDVPSPGDGGTNSFTPDGTSYIAPNYGTNLWIAQVTVLSGNLNGIGTNTQAEIQYDIQSRTNLLQTDWQYEGTILGSETTNWTPLSVSQNGRPILFLRLRSDADDGSGLPIWWQLQYFGYIGVDPNAPDSAGDGWTVYQKFNMGLNPNVFYTPPAPQLAVSYGLNSMANASWLPAPGPVTGYTLERDYYPDIGNYPDSETFNLSSNTDSFADNLSGDHELDMQDGWGPSLFVSYTLTANYAGGNSPSSKVWLENSGSYIPLVPIYMIGSGSQDTPYLVVPTLPSDTVALQLTRVDLGADAITGAFTVPVSAITNGLYQLPAAWEGTADSNGNYWWYAQTISANGSTNYPNFIQGLGYTIGNYVWPRPFYDGRAQLKQNLIFLLRAANEQNSFQFTEIATNNSTISFVNPTNYAYAGLYRSDGLQLNSGLPGIYDAFLPFEDNNQYRNFVLSLSPNQDIDGNGELTTGAGEASGYGLALIDPPTYQFQTPAPGVTNILPLLATNVTQWLLAEPGYYAPGAVGITINTSVSPNVYQMASNGKNIFGLQYLSTELAYGTSTGLGTSTLSPNGSASPSATSAINIYSGTAQPLFQTQEYDFWQQAQDDQLPGMPNFSPTNASRFTIVSAGNDIWIAAYAKLAIGSSGMYAYLQQYFDQAYQIDTNGAVTANTTGILSPYGDFFATQPGPVALVTKPDLDTGARGTNIVYAIKLAVDMNHDGVMDLSFNGPDNTSPSTYFQFWVNDNYDRWDYDLLGLTNEQDDVKIAKATDCNYTNAAGYRAIPCTRDLEDFTRLWVCGVTSNLLATLPAGSTVTLSWFNDYFHPVVGNPTIDLFAAADTDGGIGYLTNSTVAAQQTNRMQCPYIGRLAPGGSIQLNTIQFANNWAGDHFIWCGVAGGSGALALTITDANGNVLGQTLAYIQLVDIKQMYERWTVGDNPNNAPANTAHLTTEGLPVGASVFQYTQPQNTNTPYVLFVHGWNMETWEKDRFAETTFKRLYWQGYQGRFGSFRWPTYFDFPLGSWSWQAVSLRNFDNSESNSWASGAGLLNKLNDLNAQYPGKVYLIAHSMGNVAAGEALRLAGGSQVVNTYVALQGAVSAHAYDPTTPTRDLSASTPDDYAYYWTNGAPCYFNGSSGAGTYVNFFNTNDWALTFLWPEDQNLKPDNGLNYPGYFYSVSSLHPNGFYVQYGSGTNAFRNLNFPGDTYPIFSFCDEARSQALGAQAGVGGVFSTAKQIDLKSDPYDFAGNHVDHSGEFRSDNARRGPFWNAVLTQMKLK